MRFFYEGKLEAGKTIILSAEEAKHACTVLRLAPGAEVEITNGTGYIAKGNISALSRDTAEIQLTTVSAATQLISIHLWQSMLKGPKMDWLLEKAGEVGALTIQPLETEFSLTDSDRSNRWERILHSAAKQSGNPFLPKLLPVKKFAKAITEIPENSLKIFLDPYVETSLWQALEQARNNKFDSIVLALGPEGGFSDAEIDQLISAGFQATKLLPYILRGETAGVVALGIAGHFLLSPVHRP